MVDEEIVNLFNFTLKDNALKWCNNDMRNHPNYRFVEFKRFFVNNTKHGRMMKMCIYN